MGVISWFINQLITGGPIPEYYTHTLLVGGIPTSLNNMKVSWDDDIPNIWNKKKIQTTNQMS